MSEYGQFNIEQLHIRLVAISLPYQLLLDFEKKYLNIILTMTLKALHFSHQRYVNFDPANGRVPKKWKNGICL